MFQFATSRRHRRPGLTPLIDVVFLLLVFFMLAAQFGRDGAMSLSGGGAGAYSGPPRLVSIGAEAVLLNGGPIAPGALPDALGALTDTPDDAIILRAGEDADVQRLTDIVDLLGRAGFTRLVLTE